MSASIFQLPFFSAIQDISSEPENENFKKPKLLPDNILADLSKRVQDIEEIVDGQFKDIREQDSESTLIYWDGENRPRERQAEARSTFDKLGKPRCGKKVQFLQLKIRQAGRFNLPSTRAVGRPKPSVLGLL